MLSATTTLLHAILDADLVEVKPRYERKLKAGKLRTVLTERQVNCYKDGRLWNCFLVTRDKNDPTDIAVHR